MPKDKVALVTGAGSGIGRASALALLADGYSVTLVGRRKAELDKTAEQAKGGRPLEVPPDLGDPATVRSVLAKTKQESARLGVLFNNAGIRAPAVPVDDRTHEQWEAQVDISPRA